MIRRPATVAGERFRARLRAGWRTVIVLAAWLASVGSLARAMEIRLPLLDGELSGVFTALKLAGAPDLHWKVGLTRIGPAGRDADLSIEGAGTALRVRVSVAASGEVRWQLVSGRIDLAAWSETAAAQLGPDWSQAMFRGIITAQGEGSWGPAGLSGQARFTLENGRIENPANRLVLEGISADLTVDDLAARRTPTDQMLRWSGGQFDAITLGPGQMNFSVDGEQVSVEELSGRIWGGVVRLAAFGFSLDNLEVAVVARVVGIDVAQLLPFLPPVLAEAEGRLDGSFSIRRDSAGIQIGAGRLALQPGEPAELRLAPTPGLLSSSLPSAVLKYYPGLGKIETGEIPLQANLLEVTFTPGGDAEGRTASIHLAGGPVDPKLRAPIDLTVNVRGPLESLVKFGTNSRLRFGQGR